MLALIGIIGIAGIIIGAIAVVAAIVGTGCSIAAQQDAAEAADKQARMQQAAMGKAEDQAKADKIIQKKLVQRNLIKAKQQVGSSIAYQKLLAERTRRKAAKVNAKSNDLDGSSFKPASYSSGTPAQSG
jgi:UDP-N-acetylmuramate-alanine ligase